MRSSLIVGVSLRGRRVTWPTAAQTVWARPQVTSDGSSSAPTQGCPSNVLCVCVASGKPSCQPCRGGSQPNRVTSETTKPGVQLREQGKAEHLQPSKHSNCRSSVKCLINELGPPTTDAELFLAHLAAAHDYCTGLGGGKLDDVEHCNEVPFCRAMLPDADGHALVEAQAKEVAWTTSHWYYAVAGRSPTYKCRPDWFALLSQPCEGSAAAQMQHCLQDRPASGACPEGCMPLSLALDKGYCNTAKCWPPWVLKQFCDDTVQGFLNTTRFDWCTKDASCDKPCMHEACAVAARYVRSFAWTGFQGQCKHTAAVGQLLANAQSMFDGVGCSVRQWVDNSTTDLEVLMSKVCQGTYPRPALLMSILQNGGAVGKVWLDVAANASRWGKPRTEEQLLDQASRSVLSFASTQQAALIQCPMGYRAMDTALSKPWLSPELLRAVLPADSAWRARLLQGMPICGSVGNITDVCLELRAPSNSSMVNPPLVPWLVSNTSLSFLEVYCNEGFAPASNPMLPANVTASCDKEFRKTEEIRRRQASRRAALAVIWYAYGMLLLLGFVGLHVYWRFCRRRGRSSRSTWLNSIAICLWHMLCPSVHDYHPSASQAAPAGQSQPATASATWAEWRSWLISKVLSGAQALAYCIDVGLDIWTLVELRKLAGGHATLAEAYHPAGGEYYNQLIWWSQHTDSLFRWLIVVFIVQYAAGILLTLPPTSAPYDVFNYQRLQFSWGCCTLVFFTGAFGIFVCLFFFVGLWYILVADVYMLLAVMGVPAKLLQGNRLNLSAYTTVRYLCEGILEALPSALISTAILNQQLLYEEKEYKQLGVFWLSLIFSMLRIARELYKLAELTHKLRACCFSTAILDMIYHVQPQQGAGAGAAHVQGGGGAGTAKQGPASTYSKQAAAPIGASSGDSTVVTAPQPDTGMTRESKGVGPASNLAGGGSLASASKLEDEPQQRGSSGSGAAAAAAADMAATVDGGEGGVLYGSSSSTSKQRSGCCWRCTSCTQYPTVLAVYVYCCLGCIMAYLLLVCSDVIYPWLMAAFIRMEIHCSPVDPSSRRRCWQQWVHNLPPFSGECNLLMMITSMPRFSNRSGAAAADCVLSSLTCEA